MILKDFVHIHDGELTSGNERIRQYGKCSLALLAEHSLYVNFFLVIRIICINDLELLRVPAPFDQFAGRFTERAWTGTDIWEYMIAELIVFCLIFFCGIIIEIIGCQSYH